MAEKIYYINKYHRGRHTIIKGTINNLVHNYFGYTLSCGHSWNDKINTEPKTYKSLISNLNKSYQETMGSCFDQDYVSEATEDDYINAATLGYSTSEAGD